MSPSSPYDPPDTQIEYCRRCEQKTDHFPEPGTDDGEGIEMTCVVCGAMQVVIYYDPDLDRDIRDDR